MKKVLYILSFVFVIMIVGIVNVHAEELINDITITGLEKPAYQQSVLETNGSIKVPENANYSIDEIIWWYDDNNDGIYGEMNVNQVFAGVTNYFRYEIILKPNEGFEFSSKIDEESEEKEYSGTISVNNMSHEEVYYYNDGTISIVGKPFRTWYDIIKGNSQEVADEKEAEFRIDADYSLFEDGGEVYVDNNTTPLVREKDYISEEGSTIIKLTKDYISTLSTGEHTLKVVFNDDNIATASFIITKNSSNSDDNANNKTETNTNDNAENEITPPPTGIDNPTTGDNVLFYVSILILSIIGFSSTILISRKKFN